jgi:hypothetical protein
MYVIEWGSSFGGANANSQIVRVDYVGNPPQAPYVTDVFVRGAAWTPAFQSYLEDKGLGDNVLGYRVSDKPGGDILPWINVDQIVLRFSATGELPTRSSFSVRGSRAAYTVTSVSSMPGDPLAFVLTLSRPLGGGNPATGVAPTANENGDRVTLGVPGGAAGGGALSLVVKVLQGDANQNSTVLADDFSDVRKRFFTTTSGTAGTDTSYSPYHDINGSGDILANDFSEVKKRFFEELPPATVASPNVVASSVARRDRPSVTAGLFSAVPVLG